MLLTLFFCKQKTAYEMRISDWSSDLCSSDLARLYQRIGASIRQALASLFTVHRYNGPSPRLLGAEQETLVVQLLALKLEGARVALLRGDTTRFCDLCVSASNWLDMYFQNDHPRIASAHYALRLLPPLVPPPLL